jgi:hypothetical protein
MVRRKNDVSLIAKNIILRPNTEWYSDELRAAKRDRRKAERRMRKSNLTVHREMFRDTCLKTNTLLLCMLIDDGTKLRVVQFHNIYNRSFTILGNFTIVQILNQVSCVDLTIHQGSK